MTSWSNFSNTRPGRCSVASARRSTGPRTALEKLRNLVRVHLAEFQREPDMAVVYQVETHQSSRLVEAQIRDMAKMYLDIIAEIVEQGQSEGSIRKDLYLGLVKRFILGAVEEVISTWLHSGRSYDLASMADPLVDLFINGIGSGQNGAVNRIENRPLRFKDKDDDDHLMKQGGNYGPGHCGPKGRRFRPARAIEGGGTGAARALWRVQPQGDRPRHFRSPKPRRKGDSAHPGGRRPPGGRASTAAG